VEKGRNFEGGNIITPVVDPRRRRKGSTTIEPALRGLKNLKNSSQRKGGPGEGMGRTSSIMYKIVLYGGPRRRGAFKKKNIL